MHATLTQPRRRGGHRTARPAHLDRLLARRELLADELAEAAAHGYPGVADTARLLAACERAITDAAPRRANQLLAAWAERDAGREHHAADPQPETCRTCALETGAEKRAG